MSDLPETVSIKFVPTVDRAALDGFAVAASNLIKSLEEATAAFELVAIRDCATDEPADETPTTSANWCIRFSSDSVEYHEDDSGEPTIRLTYPFDGDPADEAAPSAASLYDGASADPTVAALLSRIGALQARVTCVEDALANAHVAIYGDDEQSRATSPEPLIEKFYHDTGIDAVVVYPCLRRHTSVRVQVWIDAPPHEKSGVADARILAEACKVLATVSGAHPGSEA